MTKATATCPECRAPLLSGPTCQDNFHALLALEAQVEGAAGSITHFYTVACYVLQHPDTMNYTAEALHGLKSALVVALEGRAGVEDLRRRARYRAEGPVSIMRQKGDPPVEWQRGGWRMTVTDMLAGGTADYSSNVVRWAMSIRDAERSTGEGTPRASDEAKQQHRRRQR